MILNINKKYCLFSLFTLLLFSCGKSVSNEDHHEEDIHESHAGVIEIEKGDKERFGLEFLTIEPGVFREVIKTSGTISPATGDIQIITAPKSGIVRINNISPGEYVKKGIRMATVSPEGIQGGDLQEVAIANLEAAKAEYERLKPLYEERLVTASDFKEAERAYKEAEALAGKNTSSGTVALSAPTDGVISSVYVNTGQYVEAGAEIASIVKNSGLTLTADLPARYSSLIPEIISANFIPEGSDRTIILEEHEGKKISGNHAMSASSGYIPVIFSYSGNPLSQAGMYAEVFLLGKEKTGVVSVPRDALLELQGNKYVYVSADGQHFEKRPVETGSDNGEYVEIKSGVAQGEIIVAHGASVVRMMEVSAVAPPSHTHNH